MRRPVPAVGVILTRGRCKWDSHNFKSEIQTRALDHETADLSLQLCEEIRAVRSPSVEKTGKLNRV